LNGFHLQLLLCELSLSRRRVNSGVGPYLSSLKKKDTTMKDYSCHLRNFLSIFIITFTISCSSPAPAPKPQPPPSPFAGFWQYTGTDISWTDAWYVWVDIKDDGTCKVKRRDLDKPQNCSWETDGDLLTIHATDPVRADYFLLDRKDKILTLQDKPTGGKVLGIYTKDRK
jgi:hypothetical protein